MSINAKKCECGATFGSDNICPDCGNFNQQDAGPSGNSGKSNSLRSGRSSKSGRARAAANSVKSHVSARPSTVATISGMVGDNSTLRRRRSDISLRSSSKRRGIAAGLVEVAPLPPMEPLKIIRPELIIPREQRVCYNPDCKWVKDPAHNGVPRNLYRERDGVPIDQGVCPSCKSPFNFAPIAKDTVINAQYQVMGPVAVGGFGFIYLAWDLNVGRYVVLKGLLNSKDPEQQANAVQERRFLADLQDSHIVNIVNFVTYEDPATKDKQTFIVMEFIDGKTLKQIKKEWMKAHSNEPLPVTEAIYYILGLLPAFTYLHKHGVVYCDFKMDNAMYQGERLRLIDMGGCRRLKDTGGANYFTRGYAAPEAAGDDWTVSVASDLYSVGRTLAILSMNFEWSGDFNQDGQYVPGKHEFDLPTPDSQPIFAKYESFYRFLLRACHADPDQRFQSADEMADQLLGVLGEIVSIDSEKPRPLMISTEFSADFLREQEKPTFRSITDLKPDQTDPAIALIESALASNDLNEQAELYRQCIVQFPKSAEAPLRLASVLTDLGAQGGSNSGTFLAEADKLITEQINKDPFDFRNVWVKGRWLLAQAQYEEAYRHFDAVYSEVPGELAPKLALAIAAELKGDVDTAIRYYELVSGVDRNYVTAAFGLARCLQSRDAAAAVEAYERVNPQSISYVPALMAKARAILSHKPDAEGFKLASDTILRIKEDNLEMHKLKADFYLAAVGQLGTGLQLPTGTPSMQLLGTDLRDAALRDAAERELRDCARYSEGPNKITFVDRANAVRRNTMF